MSNGQGSMRACEIWVELNSLFEHLSRDAIILVGEAEHMFQIKEIVFIGRQVVRGLGLDMLPHGPARLCRVPGRDGCNDFLAYVILYREDVFQIAVIAFGPIFVAGRRVRELRRDSESLADSLYSPFQDILDSKFSSYLLHRHRFALVSENRVACDHKKIPKTRQVRDDFLRNP